MVKRVLLGATAVLLAIAAAYASFFVAPEERTMGALQRIFYLHASCAWAGLTAFSICFLQSPLCMEAQGKIRLAGGFLRGSRHSVYDHRSDFRPYLGQTGLGHLLDVG